MGARRLPPEFVYQGVIGGVAERKNLTEMMNAPVQEGAAKNGFARMRELLGG